MGRVVAVAAKKSFEELYQTIVDLPEGQRGEILTPGELHITMGRPGKKHRRAAQVLYVALASRDANVGGTGWWIELEAEVRLGDRLFDPDLAGWRVERVPELPDENPIAIVPDWCCEILSPSTAANDLRIKLPNYLASGVPFVWIVEPVGHLVQVFGAQNDQPVLVATASDEEHARLQPFGLEIDVRRLWTSAKPGY
jgi:Uma2 family endonuclease